jgi:hypothetical protein
MVVKQNKWHQRLVQKIVLVANAVTLRRHKKWGGGMPPASTYLRPTTRSCGCLLARLHDLGRILQEELPHHAARHQHLARRCSLLPGARHSCQVPACPVCGMWAAGGQRWGDERATLCNCARFTDGPYRGPVQTGAMVLCFAACPERPPPYCSPISTFSGTGWGSYFRKAR